MADQKKSGPFKIFYTIECVLYSEDEPEKSIKPMKIESLNIGVDYSKVFTPLMTITLKLTHTDVEFVKTNDRSLLMNLQLCRVKGIDNANSSGSQAVEKDIVLDVCCIPVIETEDIENLRNFEKAPDKKSSQEDMAGSIQDRVGSAYAVRFYLTTVDYTQMYKRTINTVLRGPDNSQITVDTALRFLCETAGLHGYILDKPDNVIPQDNIILPPGNIRFAFDVLQKLYGCYLDDMLVFYDLDGKLYVLSRLSSEHDFEEGKIKESHLRVAVRRDVDSFPPGLTVYDGNTIISTVIGNVEDGELGVSSGEAYGDIIVFSNYGFADQAFQYKDGELDSITKPSREYLRDAISHRHTGTGVSFEYDELNNNFNLFSMLATYGASSMYIVNLKSVDIDMLKPNVVYSISLLSENENDNDRYVGRKFPLAAYTLDFYRDNEITQDAFSTNARIMLLNMDKRKIALD